MPELPVVDGTCDTRFTGVRDAFAANLTERGELGAAVCVTAGGRVVVDLWGGHADAARRRPWRPDTLVNVFSVGKGLVAVLAARLAGEGRLDADDRVVTHWPAFGAAGKEQVTVRHLLAHQAGLPALRAPLPASTLYDWDAMADALAAEEPWWEPGTAHGYHVNTYGFLVGEVLRRITGERPGALLRRHVAGPLGADVHLGFDAGLDARVAEFVLPDAPVVGRDDLSERDLMRYHAYVNPPGVSGFGVVNTRAWRAAEIPSTNTHASARGVARVYTALAAGGTVDGVTVVDRGALAAAVAEQARGPDLVLDRPTRFGLGFQLTQPERPLGPGAGAFGHFGAGGSLGFCDPDAGVGFGYVNNRLESGWQNPRNRALIDAVFAALA